MQQRTLIPAGPEFGAMAGPRLAREWRDLQKHAPGLATLRSLCRGVPIRLPLHADVVRAFPTEDVVLFPRDDALCAWSALLTGPAGTPYEHARFELRLSIPAGYPHAPPMAVFVTPVCHANVKSATGEICLDILAAEWSPSWSLEALARAIQALLAAPAADSPLNVDVANALRAGDARAHWSMVRAHTIEHAVLLPLPQAQARAETAGADAEEEEESEEE